MTITRVDFSHVAPQHAAIDARLANWARWCNNRTGSTASPMFRLYRSTEQWADNSKPSPVDAMDAQRIQRGVGQLPSRQRLAISWCYIKRNNPAKAAQSLGESLQGLLLLIETARQRLIDNSA